MPRRRSALPSVRQRRRSPAREGDPVGQDFLAAKLTPFPNATVTLAPAGASMALTGASSATLYGQALSLTPAASPTLAELDFTTPHVAVSCNIAQATFTVSKSASPEIVVAGHAPIAGAGVVFPVYNAAPAALPQPADAWGIVVVTGVGLSATIAPLTAPLALAGASFALTPARLSGWWPTALPVRARPIFCGHRRLPRRRFRPRSRSSRGRFPKSPSIWRPGPWFRSAPRRTRKLP